MKNVSYSAKENDIKNFFKNYYIAENGIKFLKNRRGNFIGEVAIGFTNDKDCEKAIREKNKELLLNL
jgi:RNA recognition motif-containing protein